MFWEFRMRKIYRRMIIAEQARVEGWNAALAEVALTIPVRWVAGLPSEDDLRAETRRQVCREEGHREIETTRIGGLELEYRCGRCAETWTKARPVYDIAEPWTKSDNLWPSAKPGPRSEALLGAGRSWAESKPDAAAGQTKLTYAATIETDQLQHEIMDTPLGREDKP